MDNCGKISNNKKPDIRPSRFLLNLQEEKKEELNETKIEKIENWIYMIDDKIQQKKNGKTNEKQPQKGDSGQKKTLDFSGDLIIEPGNLQDSADQLFEPKAKKENNKPGKAYLFFKNIDSKLSRLAFYGVIKIFFKAVYRFLILCNYLGRAVLFLLGLVGNVFYKASLPFQYIARKLFLFFSNNLIKFIFFFGKVNLFSSARIRAERTLLVQLKNVAVQKETEPIKTAHSQHQRGSIHQKKNNLTAEIKKSIITISQSFYDFHWKNLLPKPRISSARNVVSFSAMLFLLVLPIAAFVLYESAINLKGRVLGVSETAVGGLVNASESAQKFNFIEAGQDFSRASKNFIAAESEIKSLSIFLSGIAPLIPNNDIKLAADSNIIFESGRIVSEIGQDFTKAMALLFQKKKDILTTIEELNDYLSDIDVKLAKLNDNLSKINPEYLPAEYQGKFSSAYQKSLEVEKNLTELNGILGHLKEFLGGNKDKRYLLVFQNNTEMRASGGFIGSFALIDFHDGKIKNIEAPGGGTYDTEAGLYERVAAPEPLQLLNPLWHFWDANWWPDWPTSARKLMWFYERSDGPTVDGVISLTPSVIEDVLAVIGPVDMRPDYDVVIDSQNFWEITQKISEQKPDVTKTPKKFIGELMNKIINELPQKLNKDILLNLIASGQKSLTEKQILLNFNDEALQKKIDEYDWGGRIKETSGDYFSVINTNIGGGKSDKKIRQAITHQATIGSDGNITDDVIIKREHTAGKGEEFTGVRNIDYMRIYVPLGAELLEVSGFNKPDISLFEQPDPSWKIDPDLIKENQAIIHQASNTKIYNENNKTVFANWSQIDPGETIEIHLKYKLPFNIYKNNGIASNNYFDRLIGWLDRLANVPNNNVNPYSLLVQKQAGAQNVFIHSRLVASNAFKSIWHYPTENNDLYIFNQTDILWRIDDALETDKFFVSALQNN